MQEQKQEELKQTTDAPKVENEELKQATDAPKVEEDKIDYKAELEKLKKERDNYKEGLLNAKKKLKEGDLDIDAIVEEKLSNFKNEINSTNVNSILDSLSQDPAEKELIKEHYNNSINKTGTSAEAIRNDLENAKLLANKAKLIKENTFLKEALIAKNSMSASGIGSNTDKNYSEEIKLNSLEQSLFDRLNERRARAGRQTLSVQDFVAGKIN